MANTNFLDEISTIVGQDAMPVWEEFQKISNIPRGSKNEGEIIGYIKARAELLGLKYEIDGANNIVVFKPSTNGSDKTVMLQSHVDMVADKEKESTHDFSKDPVRPYVDGEWVKARETTLGADNGIGVAMQLALMTSKDAQHPNLELLFTVDEETGLNGALALKLPLKANYMINLDSEEGDVIFVGCASSLRWKATLPGVTEAKGNGLVEITLNNFPGGHSGVQIHETARGNPINLMGYLLSKRRDNPIDTILNINGGTKMNGIPRDCVAAVSQNLFYNNGLEDVMGVAKHYNDANLNAKPFELDSVLTTSNPRNVINALSLVHSGVLFLETSKYALVETSNNIGIIHTTKDGVIMEGMLRSSNDYREQVALNLVRTAFESNNFAFEVVGRYAGWQPKDNYRLLDLALSNAKTVFGSEKKVEAVHAGLECGPLNGFYPGMEIISLGPKIVGPHSPSEKVEIQSVGKSYQLIRAIIKEL
jgi:dipeptidase D